MTSEPVIVLQSWFISIPWDASHLHLVITILWGSCKSFNPSSAGESLQVGNAWDCFSRKSSFMDKLHTVPSVITHMNLQRQRMNFWCSPSWKSGCIVDSWCLRLSQLLGSAKFKWRLCLSWIACLHYSKTQIKTKRTNSYLETINHLHIFFQDYS